MTEGKPEIYFPSGGADVTGINPLAVPRRAPWNHFKVEDIRQQPRARNHQQGAPVGSVHPGVSHNWIANFIFSKNIYAIGRLNAWSVSFCQ